MLAAFLDRTTKVNTMSESHDYQPVEPNLERTEKGLMRRTANGGLLMVQEKGQPAPPGAGRPKNPFRQFIREMSDNQVLNVIMPGYLVDENDVPYGEKVKVQIELPSVQAVVLRAFRQAAKGNASAREWLVKTGWDQVVKLSDEDSPQGGGFVLVLPNNSR